MPNHKSLLSISLVILGFASLATNVFAIYSGDIVPDKRYSFMVQILLKLEYICGGAIIDRIHVITSGQCIIIKSHVNDYRIMSETTRLDPWRHGVIHRIKLAWQTRGYRKIGSLAYSDIAIFTVDPPFSTSVTPLKLPPPHRMPRPETLLTLTGWGAPDDAQNYSPKLKRLMIPMSDQDSCLKRARRWWSLNPEHLCIEHVTHGTGYGGAARNDLGSILSYDGFLVGIVTLPTVDIYPIRPDIYTKIDSYRQYYEEILRLETDMNVNTAGVPPVCRSPQPSTSQQPQTTESCSNSLHTFVCASVRRHVARRQVSEVESTSSEVIVIPDSPPVTSNLVDESTQSPNRVSERERVESPAPRQQIHDVGPERICVAPENVQRDAERYYVVNPQSHSSVAQQNNIQPGDVEDLRCRPSQENDDAFINFLLYGTIDSNSPNQQSLPAAQPSDQRCSSIYHNFVCALVRSHVGRRQPTHQEPTTVPPQDRSNQGTGVRVQSGSQIHDVGSQRFCVAPENIQPDPDRYFRVSPQSHAAVAQQNNIPLNDVVDLRCRRNTDDDDAFINFLLYGIPTVPPQQCTYPHHDYVCALLRSHVSRHVYNEQQRENENVAGTSQDTSSARAGMRRPSSSVHDEIGAKRFCVASEYVQPDPERYHRINPQSFSSVAHEHNIQEVDVENLRCRNRVDNDDVFVNYFQSRNTAQQSQTQNQLETDSSRSGATGSSETFISQAGSSRSQYPSSDVTRSPSEDNLDPLNFRPEPLPLEPDFTPPNTP